MLWLVNSRVTLQYINTEFTRLYVDMKYPEKSQCTDTQFTWIAFCSTVVSLTAAMADWVVNSG